MTVNAIKKAVDITMIVAADGPLCLTDIAGRSGIPVPTTRRILSTLTESAILRRVGNVYTLGIKVFEMGKKAEQAMDIIGLAWPHLEALAAKVGENANLAVLDGVHVVYLSCAEAGRVMRTFTVPGARIPAHSTGVGKVLLARHSDAYVARLYEGVNLERFTAKTLGDLDSLLGELRKVREQGYAMDEGEREDGVLCLAAPVRDFAGQVAAAVSVSGPSSRLSGRVDFLVRAACACAENVSRELGWKGEGTHESTESTST